MDGQIFIMVGCGCNPADNYRLLSVPFPPAILALDGSAGGRSFGWTGILYPGTLEVIVAKLDNIIHQPVRLQIMSSLIALDTTEEVEFIYLRKILKLTDGNLGAHLTKLENAGARYTGSAVEKDGMIITGSGPQAAAQFGKTIAQTLTSGQK